MNFAPAIPIPAPSINEKIIIGTIAFLSLGKTTIITGIADNNEIITPLIHGAISQLTNGIINPSTK